MGLEPTTLYTTEHSCRSKSHPRSLQYGVPSLLSTFKARLYMYMYIPRFLQQLTHPPSIHPPSIHPPSIHPPSIHPPSIHPPSIHPPSIHPSSIHPPSIHPPSIHPPSIHPPSIHPPSIHPPSIHPPSIHYATGIHVCIHVYAKRMYYNMHMSISVLLTEECENFAA